MVQRASRIWILVTAALLGCSDVIGPNTDFGLSVWAEVVPNSVSVRDTAAILRFRVYVANTSSKEISVVSGGPPYGGGSDPSTSIGLWGSMRIANDTDQFNAGPNVSWFGAPVYVFAPRKYEYNEYSISLAQWQRGGWKLTPGAYVVRSWMNTREGRSAILTLFP